MKAFLLGAGASRGTLDELVVPVAGEFGGTLASMAPDWARDYPALFAVVNHLGCDLQNWPLEPVWSCIDYYAKLQPALPLLKPWTNESQEIKKALLALYGQRCDEAVPSDDSTLVRLLRDEMRAGDALISFNYDTIAERIAQQHHDLRVVPHGRHNIRFAKPHGSTSWTLDLNAATVTWSSDNEAPLLSSLKTSDVDCRREPLVLGTVPIKSELIKEVQGTYGLSAVFDVIGTQWRATVEAVRDAETIMVVGYSFPPEDQYGRFMVREGLRLRTRRVTVEFFELPHFEAERARTISELFRGHLQNLVFRGPVEPRHSERPHNIQMEPTRR